MVDENSNKIEIKKIDETAPHKTVLVLDGLIGQAAQSQVNAFLHKIFIKRLIIPLCKNLAVSKHNKTMCPCATFI